VGSRRWDRRSTYGNVRHWTAAATWGPRPLAVPDKLYGSNIGSSYQQQGLALSKQFKRVAEG
jgi:hypothetical protein